MIVVGDIRGRGRSGRNQSTKSNWEMWSALILSLMDANAASTSLGSASSAVISRETLWNAALTSRFFPSKVQCDRCNIILYLTNTALECTLYYLAGTLLGRGHHWRTRQGILPGPQRPSVQIEDIRPVPGSLCDDHWPPLYARGTQ